jgi:hypothetical protein
MSIRNQIINKRKQTSCYSILLEQLVSLSRKSGCMEIYVFFSFYASFFLCMCFSRKDTISRGFLRPPQTSLISSVSLLCPHVHVEHSFVLWCRWVMTSCSVVMVINVSEKTAAYIFTETLVTTFWNTKHHNRITTNHIGNGFIVWHSVLWHGGAWLGMPTFQRNILSLSALKMDALRFSRVLETTQDFTMLWSTKTQYESSSPGEPQILRIE